MVLFLEELFHISNFQHVVQPLQAVKDVNYVVVGVFFEIAEGHFASKAH